MEDGVAGALFLEKMSSAIFFLEAHWQERASPGTAVSMMTTS